MEYLLFMTLVDIPHDIGGGDLIFIPNEYFRPRNSTALPDDQSLIRAGERTSPGTDQQGTVHCHDTATGLIRVVHDGAVVQHFTVPVGRWATNVAYQSGWERLNFYERPTGTWLADVAGEVA
jgi:hypothetical protein